MTYRLFVRRIVLLLPLFFIAAFVSGKGMPVYAQQAYGHDSYGACAYSEGCTEVPLPPPTTVVPITPSPDNPSPGRAVSVNITNDQIFSGDNYTVTATPNFSFDQIASILFYQNDELIGETDQPVGESYQILWQLPADGAYIVRVVVVLTDGSRIEHTFNVMIRQGQTETDEVTAPADPDAPTSTSTHQSVLQRSFGAVTEFMKRLIAATPPAVAYAIPYIFLALLGGIAALLLLQTKNQFAHIVTLLRLLEKDKLLAEEKTTFIMLVSHHLRTPLTILQSSIDMLSETASNSDFVAAQEGVRTLQQKSESILKSVANNSHLKAIKMPDILHIRQKLYYSWQVIAPTLLSILILIVLNAVYVAAGKTVVVVPNILLQAVVFVAGYVVFQRYQQRQEEAAHVVRQRKYEEVLDKARNSFILRVAKDITPIVNATKEACKKLDAGKEAPGIEEAFARLDTMISRFVLAAELERGKIAATLAPVEVKPVVSKVIEGQKLPQTTKKLKVKKTLQPHTATSNEFLLRYVITAIYDNAIRYAQEGSAVHVALGQGSKLVVENQGKGIPADKLDSLFKPFSSSEDVSTFNSQGMGLNLYLSRLIMRYLEGDVALESVPNKKTTVTVTLPS